MIKISLEEKENAHLLLTIQDNGSGLKNNNSMKNSDSIGMVLMGILSKQLNGDISFSSENGLKIAVNFKKEEISKNNEGSFGEERSETYQKRAWN